MTDVIKYHVNSETGDVGVCEVKVESGRSCPLGGEHFDTRAEATREAEVIVKEIFSTSFEEAVSKRNETPPSVETFGDNDVSDKDLEYVKSGTRIGEAGFGKHARHDWTGYKANKKFRDAVFAAAGKENELNEHVILIETTISESNIKGGIPRGKTEGDDLVIEQEVRISCQCGKHIDQTFSNSTLR